MTETSRDAGRALPARRAFLTAVLSAGLALAGVTARAEALAPSTAQRIADHFSSIKTMTGDFVQIGPTGKQSGGKFYIDRPGRIRFNYDASSPLKVVSNGSSVAIGNTKLGTWQLYPLSSTPLKLLLSPHIDLGSDMVKSVREGPDLVTVVLGDRHLFGNSTITMMFDPSSYSLKQWTITDAQGKNTTVMIYNVKTGVQLAGSLFQLPKAATKSVSPRQ